ncbi:MAG TPA: DNA double-strand break repair nuclease NurA [Pyrinomonadaceae bacterium]|nr:DNA double-strand break repair nuclease NurA [Pyrinomonadaceae bacterium]
MIYRQKLLDALTARRGEFVGFEREWRAEVERGARALLRLGERNSLEVRAELGERAAPGAIPSDELERLRRVVVPFAARWRSHDQARRWAQEALFNRVTFAADGSQILPGREISLPVAGVQAASFLNRHTRDGGYTKDARFEVIMPGELLEGDAPGAGSPEAVVSLRRFELEVRTVRDFLEASRGWQERGERTPVAFFDGTLLISHARPRNRVQDKYVGAVVELVRLSRETRVPVVGYIDQSYARDLVNLLDVLQARERHRSAVYDAQLLRAPLGDALPPLLATWGARTVFFYCLREGLPEDFRDEQGDSLVGFVYLQTTGDGHPARLDVPSWVYEAGLLEDVLDAVRAECVVGNGYPYALETADAAAVVTAQDRALFLRLVQEFAEEAGLAFRVSRKALSKAHRR